MEGNERRDNSAMIRLTTLPADLTHEQLAGLQTASYGHQIVITTMSYQVHLLLFITRKYAIICVKRPSIARRDIHERESTNICA